MTRSFLFATVKIEMPRRPIVLANGEIYHVYNRSIGATDVFVDSHVWQRALLLMRYYRLQKPSASISAFLRANPQPEKKLRELEKRRQPRVKIFAFALMPNHFHFLISQEKESGILGFVSDFSNSLVHYYNILNERRGPLFESVFKAVRMESEEQLIHVSRYIHLNPYSAALVKEIANLKTYPLTSLPEYLHPKRAVISEPEAILAYFHHDPEEYWRFVNDRADYQRSLEEVKHLLEGQ